MAQFDLPLEHLRTYVPDRDEPDDFDEFWSTGLAETRHAASPARFAPANGGLATVETIDVTFSGSGGDPIRGWLLLPRDRPERVPAVVQYIGYGGGRGFPFNWLLWPAAGYATLVMDTRGQGSAWLPGETPDPEPDPAGPQFPGFLTRGITDPARYYYRRLYLDAVRAIDTVREHPAVDGERVLVAGGSQGGALALAASTFEPTVLGAMIDVPFLADFRRALAVTDEYPYRELTRYLSMHRDQEAQVFRTLSYVDGRNLAARATVPSLFSVGLTDRITPPSTVFAVFNHYAGPKEIRVWPYSGHDAGDLHHVTEKLRFAAALVGDG